MSSQVADYSFMALGLGCIASIVWLLVAGLAIIRSIKPYRGTWQSDLFDHGRGDR